MHWNVALKRSSGKPKGKVEWQSGIVVLWQCGRALGALELLLDECMCASACCGLLSNAESFTDNQHHITSHCMVLYHLVFELNSTTPRNVFHICQYGVAVTFVVEKIKNNICLYTCMCVIVCVKMHMNNLCALARFLNAYPVQIYNWVVSVILFERPEASRMNEFLCKAS